MRDLAWLRYYYGDVDPDFLTGFPNGIRAKYLKPGQTERAPDDWGAIAAWAWGMSRVQDYFETDTASIRSAWRFMAFRGWARR